MDTLTRGGNRKGHSNRMVNNNNVTVIVNPATMTMVVDVGEEPIFDGFIFDWTMGRTLAILDALGATYSYEEKE